MPRYYFEIMRLNHQYIPSIAYLPMTYISLADPPLIYMALQMQIGQVVLMIESL